MHGRRRPRRLEGLGSPREYGFPYSVTGKKQKKVRVAVGVEHLAAVGVDVADVGAGFGNTEQEPRAG